MLLLPSTSFVTESAHIFEQEEHGTRGSRNIATTGVVKLNTSQCPRLHHVLPSPLATCESLTLCWESFNPQFIGFFGERREGGLAWVIKFGWQPSYGQSEREGERTPPRTTYVHPSSPPPSYCRRHAAVSNITPLFHSSRKRRRRRRLGENEGGGRKRWYFTCRSSPYPVETRSQWKRHKAA